MIEDNGIGHNIEEKYKAPAAAILRIQWVCYCGPLPSLSVVTSAVVIVSFVVVVAVAAHS